MLDKITALEKTIIIWQYIAEHNCSKEDAYIALKLSNDNANCPCCEYAIYRKWKEKLEVTTCSLCPIWNNEFSCIRDDNTYKGWQNARKTAENLNQQTKYALALVDLAKSKLEQENNSHI